MRWDSSLTPVPVAVSGDHPRPRTADVQAGGKRGVTALHTCPATSTLGDPGSTCLKGLMCSPKRLNLKAPDSSPGSAANLLHGGGKGVLGGGGSVT